jgi:hypothetical protein
VRGAAVESIAANLNGGQRPDELKKERNEGHRRTPAELSWGNLSQLLYNTTEKSKSRRCGAFIWGNWQPEQQSIASTSKNKTGKGFQRLGDCR